MTAQAKISHTDSRILDHKMDEVSPADRYDCAMLINIASRALLRARVISENTVCGHFSSHAKCHTALDFDLKEVRQRMQSGPNRQEHEVERIHRKHST